MCLKDGRLVRTSATWGGVNPADIDVDDLTSASLSHEQQFLQTSLSVIESCD